MSAVMQTPPTRIADVDALRGCALFGILVVNIGAFATPWFGLGLTDPAFHGGVDRATHFLVALLFEGFMEAVAQARDMEAGRVAALPLMASAW